MKNSKTCLNCVWSEFKSEPDSGLYNYDGDCGYFDKPPIPIEKIWNIRSEDPEELEELVRPIFEELASDCKGYELEGKGQPE